MNKRELSTEPEHVAVLDIAKYFGNFFESRKIQEFCKQVSVHENEIIATKIINNSARLSWVADKIDSVAKGRPAFQILFYIMIAESAAKLEDNFTENGKSKHYSIKFFENFLTEYFSSLLSSAFKNARSQKFLNVKEAATLLYNLRCDLAHEGKYFYFNLRIENDSPVLNTFVQPNIISHITLRELKQIVLSGALNAALSAIENEELVNRFKTSLWA
jgi:hypothetical protein